MARPAPDQLSGHQPVLQILALVNMLNRLGIDRRRARIGLLSAQVLLLLRRYPKLSLDTLCQRFYLTPRALSGAVNHLSRRGYLRANPSPTPSKSVLSRRWNLTAKGKKRSLYLLRAEEIFNRVLASNGTLFTAHFCYDLQNINSGLAAKIDPGAPDDRV